MDKHVTSPLIERYSVGLGFLNLESELKKIPNGCAGCELYLSATSRNHLPTLRSFMILSKCLENMTPIKIIFDSIEISVIRFVKGFDNTTALITKIVKVPIIEFRNCSITREFYVDFFVKENHRTIEVIFKDCRLTPNCKFTVMAGLAYNYFIRNLVIVDKDSSDSKFTTEVDGGIKRYLFRNRARHLCRMAALTLILIRRHKHTFLDLIDEQLVIYLARMIYSTKMDAEWLNMVMPSN